MPSKVNHHELKPSIRIGKAGITENVIKQIKTIMKKKKAIKVKFLPTAIHDDKKALAKQLAEMTNTRIIHRVGFTIVLERLK